MMHARFRRLILAIVPRLVPLAHALLLLAAFMALNAAGQYFTGTM